MLFRELVAIILLLPSFCSASPFAYPNEWTIFHFKGKFICPNHDGREWCVSQKALEEDAVKDDVIVDWYEYCAIGSDELFIGLDARDNDDGLFDFYFEPVVLFKSTCDLNKTGEYRLSFQKISVAEKNVTLSYEILLPNGIISKSP